MTTNQGEQLETTQRERPGRWSRARVNLVLIMDICAQHDDTDDPCEDVRCVTARATLRIAAEGAQRLAEAERLLRERSQALHAQIHGGHPDHPRAHYNACRREPCQSDRTFLTSDEG